MTADLLCRRLQKDIPDCQHDLPPSISVQPNDENVLEWKASILGPRFYPYAHGTFNLELRFPNDYPYNPPNILFTAPIYHPNIDHENGFIELKLLHGDWTPVVKISRLLIALRELLEVPDLESAVVPEIVCEMEFEREKFEARAREWTERFASGERGRAGN